MLAQRVVCHLCVGAGEYRRLVVPLKILGVGDLLSDRGMSFQGMAVLLSDHTDECSRAGWLMGLRTRWGMAISQGDVASASG